MNRDILISIIISTKDTPWSVLSKTLSSVLSSTFREYELIVIDQNNDSAIQSEMGHYQEYGNVIYLDSNDVGLSKGRNSGIKHAKGKWLLFFDDDALLPADALEKVSPILVNYRNTPIIFYGNVLTSDTNKPYLKKSIAMGRKINLLNFDSVCSIALLVNSGIFDKTGLFDERLGAGTEYGAGEESDIILRALKMDLRIEFLKEFETYHPSANVSDAAKRRSYGMGTGALYRKHIFSSYYFFAFLFIKLCSEIFLRLALVIVNAQSSEIRNCHLSYLLGCIRGFMEYTPVTSRNDS